MSTFDFSTLYTTLPHNLIKEKLSKLNREGCFYLAVEFLLLRYSVLFTVDSLSLLISLLYFDLYVLRDDALIS